jgi:hypothetical protein
MQKTLASIVLTAAVCSSAAPAFAWGVNGHTMIGQAAVAHLPQDLPAFVRAPAAKDEIVYLQAEEDRLKLGEGDEAAWAREWTTDHYLDIGDDGRIGNVVAISALPPTRDDFSRTLDRASVPVDPYSVGFLPYAILEGYQQVRTDFALWRLAVSSASKLNGDALAGANAEVSQRERLTVHDIGIFSHFVGDGSQPLHVSVHFNGWGRYPNPQEFTQSKTTHADFEGAFVDRYVSLAQIQPLVGSARELSAVPLPEIERYLQATDAQVVPFYTLEKSGAFALRDSSSAEHHKGVAFAASRLAAGSEMLDSLILTAWRTSATLKPET